MTEGPRHTEYMNVDDLRGNVANPKGHDLPLIEASMGRFGYIEQITLDERTGLLISGHGRVDALKARRDKGDPLPEGVVTDAEGAWFVPVSRGWASADDTEAEAALVGLNETVTRGGWVHDPLVALLQRLEAAGPAALVGTGYNGDDIAALIARGPEPDAPESNTVKSNGSLLTLADVTFGEPQHTVAEGDVYRIGEHVLLIEDVMTGWAAWAPMLTEGSLFVPYPGPYAALSVKADTVRMVMVQPDKFMAGHLLDKYAAVKGEDAIEKVTQTVAA